MISVAIFLTILALGKRNRKHTMKYRSNFIILPVLSRKYSYLIITILFNDFLQPNFYSFLVLQVQEEINEEYMGVYETSNTSQCFHWVFPQLTFLFVCICMHA